MEHRPGVWRARLRDRGGACCDGGVLRADFLRDIGDFVACFAIGAKLAERRHLAGALGQEVELVDAVAESEGDGSLKPAVALLPESLDDIAPARELSASQVRLVDKAQQILDLLPGPVIETGEFLHRGSEGTSLHGTKNSAHNHDLADNS